MRAHPFLLAFLGAACSTGPTSAPGAVPAAHSSTAPIGSPTSVEWLGMIELPSGLAFEGAPVGGLSSIVRETASGDYLVLSDDRSEHAPARIYRMRIGLEDGRLETGDVSVLGQLELVGPDGLRFARRSVDPEGLALGDEAIFVSSEGDALAGIAPFVAELDSAGRWRRELALPPRFVPDGRLGRGVRQNLGFESLTLDPSGRFLLAGTENALVQDGPAAAPGVPSPARILRWRVDRPERAPEEFVYEVEPISVPVPDPGLVHVNGLVDLLALTPTRMLALERQYVEGLGTKARIFVVDLTGAADVSGRDGLTAPGLAAARKQLLVDLADLGVRLENVEGMGLGARLPDGRRALLVISDDNFDPRNQVTQLHAFALDDRPVGVATVQGSGHRSPFEGRWIAGLEGVVTATLEQPREAGFWLESSRPDDDLATSEGLFVRAPAPLGVAAGDRVRVGGRVLERAASASQLPVTMLVLGALERLGTGALPEPVAIGGERRFPDHIDDDGLERFEPAADALDFWESLEGMRARVGPGTVIGPTNRHLELVVLPDGSSPRPSTDVGGARRDEGGGSVERVVLSGRLLGGLPQLAVGSRIVAPSVGIVDYSFSAYRVLVLAPPAAEPSTARCDASTSLTDAPGRLTIAAFNVENLSAAGPPERFAATAGVLVGRLGSPAVVALEEIQDDSGPAKDGTVTAARTLEALVEAVIDAGGPRYEAVWIDPEPDREGGQPGGNIRVALLVDPARVDLPRRGAAGPLDAVAVVTGASGPRFDPNPGRVAPTSPAFSVEGTEGVRRSLAVELAVAGRPLFVIANHWSSKWSDDRDWGAKQPPAKPTDAFRLAQARVVRGVVDELLAADPAARVVVLGDFNDYEWTPPIAELARPPLVDLTARLPDGDRYTYNFEGDSQVLDHVVVSSALAGGAELDVLHVNSDCPESMRTSDHDPQVARLRID